MHPEMHSNLKCNLECILGCILQCILQFMQCIMHFLPFVQCILYFLHFAMNSHSWLGTTVQMARPQPEGAVQVLDQWFY